MKQSRGRRRLTALAYAAYHLFPREGSVNFLQRLIHLFGVYAADMYVREENNRLEWVRHNQNNLRCDTVGRVAAAVQSDVPIAGQLGRGVVLGPSFTGGARWFREKYADAMAVVRALGHPTFFITFTCNPN